jgi:hypothetical protein
MTHGPSTLVNAKATLDGFFEAARDADLHCSTLALSLNPPRLRDSGPRFCPVQG